MQNLKEGFCYGCNETRPVTEDHIIPQAIGGKLTAPLCVECHKKIHPIDTELAIALQKIATLLNVKRARTENRPFRVKQVETGIEFDIDSREGRRARPEVNIQFDQSGLPIPDVKARSKDELNEILDGIRKKYGQFAKPVDTISEPISIGLVEYENTIGGRLFMRSVAKSAYLFLATHFPKEKVSSDIFSSVRDFVFQDKGISLTSFNFVHTRFMYDARRPVHGIAIHFDTQRRNIVGYVQYFGTFRFSVLIARSFPWEIAIPDLKYCFNPITGEEIPLKPIIMLPDVTIEECLTPFQTTQFVYSEVEKGLKKIESFCASISKTTIEFSDQSNT